MTRPAEPYVRVRRAIVAVAADACGWTVPEISKRFGLTRPTVQHDLKIQGVKAMSAPRGRKPNPDPNAKSIDQKKAERQARGREKVKALRDRRRFKANTAATGVAKVTVDPGASESIFATTVKTWSPDLGVNVLKDGCNNSKTGGDVLVGDLKGARLYTLTLEERATCPKTCQMWTTCMGNSMQHSTRWKRGEVLENRLRVEVSDLCTPGDQVLIRLHILGDFYSFDYLKMWVELLDEWPNLNLFGFTAHAPKTAIGGAIARVRDVLGQRFAIRHSGMTGEWGSFTLDFPTELPRIGDAVVCPEQRHANGDIEKNIFCGNCGACWKHSRPIAFIIH